MAVRGRRAVVIGAGHNGLIAACYLARAGMEVTVLEALSRPGGGSRTEQTVPGYAFDLHSVAHNIINMTSIPRELELEAHGLRYAEMDPFSVAIHADGRRVRFFRSIDRTVASIAESDPREAQAYRRFIEEALPLVRRAIPALRGQSLWRTLPGGLGDFLRIARRGPLSVAHDLLGPYESLLQRKLPSDLTRGPISAFAAHAGVGPTTPGGAFFAYWQAAYHIFGQWHAMGGSQGLIDALMRRCAAAGIEVRCSARVERLERRGGTLTGVVLAGGERIEARHVIAAIDPRSTLLELVQPPLPEGLRREYGSMRRSNVVQALLHVAIDRLPQYPGARPGDWNGLQSYVDRLADLSAAWVKSEAGELPDPLPLYMFTTSALDDTLAPRGHHTAYIACPAAPAEVRGGWDNRRDEFVENVLAEVERRAPGFRASIVGMAPWTPGEMMRQEGWPGAHPMHLDITLDQLGPMRPTPSLANYRTPVRGLYVSGAGTRPSGGIAGTPGKMAAQALLRALARGA